MISDMLIHQIHFSAIYIMGSLLVAMWFIVVNVNNKSIDDKLNRFVCYWKYK